MSEFIRFINLKNVKLKGRPLLEWMLFYDPTDRLMLWIISKCKETFNPKHFLQYAKSNNLKDPNDHKLKKHLELLQSLKARGFIKQDKHLNYKVTLKGQLHRLTTHPQWTLIQGIALIVAITFGMLNYLKNTQSSNKSPGLKNSNLNIFDSSHYNDSPIQTLKSSDSSFLLNRKNQVKKDST